VHAALRSFLGLAAVKRVRARSRPSEVKVLALAASERQAMRKETRSRATTG